MARVGQCCAATINGPESEFRLERLAALLRMGLMVRFGEGYMVICFKSKKRQSGLQFGS